MWTSADKTDKSRYHSTNTQVKKATVISLTAKCCCVLFFLFLTKLLKEMRDSETLVGVDQKFTVH